MNQDIENIIKKWLKKHKDDGQWVSDYDGEFDLDSCCLDGNFDLNDLADEVLKVVVEKIESYKKIELLKLRSCENDKINWNYHQGKVHQLEDLLSNLSPNKDNKNNE